MANNPYPAPEPVVRFNLETMSGVFPGTRTQIYQRIQVFSFSSDDGIADERSDTEKSLTWLQLLWYDDPRSCVISLLERGTADHIETPLLHLHVPAMAEFGQRLQIALHEQLWGLRTCGSCHFWQRSSTQNDDGLTLGHCRWQHHDGAAGDNRLPELLTTQSELALSCQQWTECVPDSSTEQPITERQGTPQTTLRMRRAAEDAEIRLSFLERLQRRWLRHLPRQFQWRAQHTQASPVAEPPMNWETLLIERSGVGAGTEGCFACQGRIANLGALTVATPEDDKQTYSIWRCRNCHTLYLNNWIDRWERLDSLETEESYYRIAPAEALTLLTLIYQAAGGEHPHRRHERHEQRQVLLDFIATRKPLSHQIRQGR